PQTSRAQQLRNRMPEIATSSENLREFSLTKGGPFFKMLVHSGLIKPEFARPARRAIFLALFIWLPLFVLSIAQGLAFPGSVGLPFVMDFTVWIRFLICVPLLIIAEVVLETRTNTVVRHFISSGLVQPKDYPAFESCVRKAAKLRDSSLA